MTYFYVCERSLVELSAKTKKGEEIKEAEVHQLFWCHSDEIMIPVDMRGADELEGFNDPESLL